MSDVAEFNRLTDDLKRKKNYKKDELAAVHNVFMALQLTETVAKEICAGLSRLQWLDAVSLLASKWPDIPEGSRYVFFQWRWDGKEKEAVIPACLAMAAAIYPIDAVGGATFLSGAITSAKFPATGRPHLLKGLRKSWMETRDGASSPALVQLTWEKMEPAWRWELADAAVDAALAAPRDIKGKGPKADHRKVVLEWLASLSRSHAENSTEAKRLEGLVQRLNRAATPSPSSSERPTAVGHDTTRQDQPSAQRTVAAGSDGPAASTVPASQGKPSAEPKASVAPATSTSEPTGHYDRVVAAGDRAFRALDALSEETRLYREAAARQLGVLERRLEAADEAKKVADADVQQLRRDVQAERSRCAAAQTEAAKYSDDLDAARKQVAELQNQLEQLREKLHAAQETAGQLEAHAEEDRRKHSDILENERQEAKRLVGQKIAQAILPDVRHLREIEQEPPSADQAKFLRALLGEIVKRLKALDIPIEG